MLRGKRRSTQGKKCLNLTCSDQSDSVLASTIGGGLKLTVGGNSHVFGGGTKNRDLVHIRHVLPVPVESKRGSSLEGCNCVDSHLLPRRCHRR